MWGLNSTFSREKRIFLIFLGGTNPRTRGGGGGGGGYEIYLRFCVGVQKIFE